MTKKNSQLNKPNLSFSSSNLFLDHEKKIQPIPETTQNNTIFFNTCFDKNHVKELVSWFLNQYGEKRTINFLESLKFLGFNNATKAGISLGIEDLQIPPEKSTLITEAHIATHRIEQHNSEIGGLISCKVPQVTLISVPTST
jgi:DNA-directed RNA polymerase subunit beta'